MARADHRPGYGLAGAEGDPFVEVAEEKITRRSKISVHYRYRERAKVVRQMNVAFDS